jgi:hypothetical protein
MEFHKFRLIKSVQCCQPSSLVNVTFYSLIIPVFNLVIIIRVIIVLIIKTISNLT